MVRLSQLARTATTERDRRAMTAEQTEARAVEDAAWNLKDVAADLIGRALTESDLAVLASVRRDLERLHERMVEVRDRRRRKRNGAAAEPATIAGVDPQPKQEEPAT